jgi:ubiquitin C-terminal hydrolase
MDDIISNIPYNISLNDINSEELALFNKMYLNKNNPLKKTHYYSMNIGGLRIPLNSDSDSDSESESYLESEKNTSDTKIIDIEKLNNIEEYRNIITTYGLSPLVNIGNTCYMNSILQCLCSVEKLRSYLISGKFYPILEERQKTLLSTSYRKKHNVPLSTQLTIAQSFLNKKCENTVTHNLHALQQLMWSAKSVTTSNGTIFVPENPIVTPRKFKNIMSTKHQMFAGTAQHDSEEMLNKILEAVHDDLCFKVKSVRFCNVSDDVNTLRLLENKYLKLINDLNETLENKQLIKQTYENYKHTHKKEVFILKSFSVWEKIIMREYSIVTKLFSGLYSSEIVCTVCNNSNIIFEQFTTISLPIPDTKNVTLKDCLSAFCTSEKLDGENKYSCSECKQKNDATKTMYIWRSPEIMIIHLKRFTNMGRKLDTNISYPLTGLKLTNCQSKFNKNDCAYDLFAVSKHMGSYRGGHYTASCLNSLNNKWYECNDSVITHIPNKKIKKMVTSQNGYILFYKKKI